jgi:hypothetical protein
VLASLGYQLDKAEELLFQTQEWEKSGKFAAVIARCPEAKPSVEFFRRRYRAMSPTEKSRLTTAFLDAIDPLTADPLLRKIFAASTPGIDWQRDVEATGQTVCLDFNNIHDPESRRFAMLWIFLSLYEFLKQRGRKPFPFVVTIDEFASLTQQVSEGVNPLAVLMNELITQYCRNHQIWLTCAFQSIYQLDEELRKTILRVGNLVIGRTALDEARVIANLLARKNPYLPKLIEEEWREEINHKWVKWSSGYHQEEWRQWVLVDRKVTSYLTLEEQQELYAQKISGLRRFEFLLRPAVREGEVSIDVIPISIAKYARNSETGEDAFPNQELVTKLYARLAASASRQAAPSVTEQDAQPTECPVKVPPQTSAHPAVTPAVGGNGSQPVVLPSVPAPPQPTPRSTQKTQSLPTLTATERSFLAFLSEHPDMPISQVYKGLGMSVWKGNEIRESLKAKGLLTEADIRTSRSGAGRPAKCVLLTFQAYQLFGIDPPTGRGSMLHRHVQSLIRDGATAKGYTATVEKVLGNGAIVDVHLEKPGKTIGVEIAIFSTPEREIAHIRNCLAAGYNQVFVIFADEHLQAHIASTIQETFSQQDAEKVRLLSLRQLPHVGEG